MNSVFARWELGRHLSTMERLEAERNKLLRARYQSRVVSLAVWTLVFWLLAYRLGVWLAEKGGGL